MSVRVDRARCRGHAQCAAIAPEVFTLGEDDRVVLLTDQVPPGLDDAVADAVLMCPEAAIEADPG